MSAERRSLIPLLAVLALAGCGGGLTSNAPAPSITSFTAAEEKVLPGESSTLTAVFTGGTGSISPLIGPVSSGSPVPTGPLAATTTFQLRVDGSQGIVRERTLTLGVMGFQPTSPALEARIGHTSTLLPDGRVLVAGGQDDEGEPLATAELFDPATGGFTRTGRMTAARAWHTATPLPSGRVLIVAGYGGEDLDDLSSAEVYDPATGTFAATGGLLYGVGLEQHTATLLVSGPHAGKVLVAGGYSSDLDEDNAVSQLYDPATSRFTLHSLMLQPRSGHDAVPLPDGSVLFVGGYSTALDEDLATSERYDSARMAFVPVGSMAVPRYGAAVVPLPDGRVLVAGGEDMGEVHADSELFLPATGVFQAGPALASGRSMGQAALLPGGRVLLYGGFDQEDTVLAQTEVFDPRTNRMQSSPAGTARALGSATRLKDGSTLFLGGWDGAQTLTAGVRFR